EMDWVNVMCYDFDYANHSTYAAATDGMNQWTSYGVAKDKLVMGTPFYGRYGTSWSDTHAKTYGNILSDYKAINGSYPAADVDSYVDAAGHTTYFNGVTTVQKKMAFVRDSGFGGAMIGELGQDHWNGAGKYDSYSLLPVINSMLRPPAWLAPASGSLFDFVANTFYAGSGAVTFSGNAWAANAGLSLSIATAGSVTFTTTQRLASLSIAAGGKLDLTDDALALDYPAGGASPLGSWTGS